jgi:pimeloyl-ACP methyl ester carboxylesterase
VTSIRPGSSPANGVRTIHTEDGVALAVEDSGGGGPPIVLAHGLTATRRYVVHGSRLLGRSGYRVISYDARGHGDSSPAPDRGDYGYPTLVADLEAVLDQVEVDRAVLVGASMGAATVLAFALEHAERVAALVQVTPAHIGFARSADDELDRWDALADALERDGVEGFVRAYGEPPVADRFKGLIVRAIRQRIERHRHPEAVAAALRVVPRSHAFEGADALTRVEPPTLIVASRDELDPEHPYEVAERYGELIPDSELVSEEAGESPLAWRGAALSKAIAGFLQDRGLGPSLPQ